LDDPFGVEKGGVVAVSVVGLTQTTLLHGLPLIVIPAPLTKLEPVTVMVHPPTLEPRFGVTRETAGARRLASTPGPESVPELAPESVPASAPTCVPASVPESTPGAGPLSSLGGATEESLGGATEASLAASGPVDASGLAEASAPASAAGVVAASPPTQAGRKSAKAKLNAFFVFIYSPRGRVGITPDTIQFADSPAWKVATTTSGPG
jgi:hypothetical protein